MITLTTGQAHSLIPEGCDRFRSIVRPLSFRSLQDGQNSKLKQRHSSQNGFAGILSRALCAIALPSTAALGVRSPPFIATTLPDAPLAAQPEVNRCPCRGKRRT